MAIIVVSTQMGAGGPEIGMKLGQKMGFRYVDQELVLDVARRYGVAEDKLSHLDESKPTIFERFDAETRHHITVLQTTLLELAELDNCIFMRGGGQWLLRGVGHVVRVRMLAPFEHRVKCWIRRVAAMTGETPNQRAAADYVRRDDSEKSGRMRYLYEVDLKRPDALRAHHQHRASELRLGRPDDGDRRAPAEMPPRDRAEGDRFTRAGIKGKSRARHPPRTRRYRITVEAQDGV